MFSDFLFVSILRTCWIKIFSTNVPFMEKPLNWFVSAKFAETHVEKWHLKDMRVIDLNLKHHICTGVKYYLYMFLNIFIPVTRRRRQIKMQVPERATNTRSFHNFYNIHFHWQFLITNCSFWLISILLWKFNASSK